MNNNTWITTAEKLYKIQENIRNYKKSEEKLIAELKKLSNYKSKASEGYEFKRFTRKGNVVYSNIPELQKIDLERYRADDIIYWRLSFHPEVEMPKLKEDI